MCVQTRAYSDLNSLENSPREKNRTLSSSYGLCAIENNKLVKTKVGLVLHGKEYPL